MHVEVCVKTDTLSHRQNITGQIFLVSNNWSFPRDEWSDFPVIVVAWWLEALKNLLRDGGIAECQFMDGPYHFRVSSLASDKWLVECGRTDPDFSPQYSAEVQPREFMSSLRSAALSLIVACNNHGWCTSDTKHLNQLCPPAVASGQQ